MTEKPKNKYAVPLTPYAPGGDLGVSINAKKTADDFLKEASRKCFSEKDVVIDSIARPYILEAMEAFHQSQDNMARELLKKSLIYLEDTELLKQINSYLESKTE